MLESHLLPGLFEVVWTVVTYVHRTKVTTVYLKDFYEV